MQQVMHREYDLLLDEQQSHRTVSREEKAQDILIDESNSGMSDLIKTWWHKALDYI